MVTPTENHSCIKDHIIVSNNPTTEALTSQGVVVYELAGFNNNDHKAVCSTARKSGGGDKWTNVSSITEARLAIDICSAKYYEDMG